MAEIGLKDYSLTGESNEQAIERGLASATWYSTPLPREKMRELLARRDGPAIRDTLIWFGVLIVSGVAGYLLWGSWWAIIPFAIYGVFYGSASEARWHECSHGTPFKTDWMNNAVYEMASFMCLFESTVWRWSHTRHHSDTIIVGRDPEISVPRPPDIKGMLLNIFILALGKDALRKMVIHACGELTDDERAYIPKSEHRRVFVIARIYLLILGAAVGWSVYLGSFLPLMYIGLPSFYGSWLRLFHSTPQHAGLAEDVLDHRLNCRTVYLNPLNRFIYWNMNYHIEHHMFPLVPYHALPKLHALI
ncbi:MAG: fatty acid desaturase, partial [Verrucomicrobia bacterium]